MLDYREKQNRLEYFTQLYEMNLLHGVMPGLVYLYMPELARRLSWSADQKLWFAFLNGMTQNPVTSLILMSQLPECPAPDDIRIVEFEEWFNANWSRLQFDTDRRYQKRDTVAAIQAYAWLVEEFDGQVPLLTGSYEELWGRVKKDYVSFGRLSAFSYLEYVYLNGFGADCTDLMFADADGSRSHRNGMLFLHGWDELVHDKRANNGCTGKYKQFDAMCATMKSAAAKYLDDFRTSHPGLGCVGNFTLESQLCQFKNHFFARRYPGVYADMAWERILWAEQAGWEDFTKVFREIRDKSLPRWLLMECEDNNLTIKQRAAFFPTTGMPYRGEHFLTINS